jgi:hypothetical protein
VELFNENVYFHLKTSAISELKEDEFQIIFPLIVEMEKEDSIPIG